MAASIAERIFKARMDFNLADADLYEILCEHGSINGHMFENWHFDDYDSSIEFDGCANDWRLTADDQALLWASGFQRTWLNHQDGSETYYRDGGDVTGYRKPPNTSSPTP